MSLSLVHICEFGHHQRDTFGSSAGGGGLREILNLLTFSSVHGNCEGDHELFMWFSDAAFGQVSPG